MDLMIFLGLFAALLIIGAPIYLAMIFPSIIYIFLNPGLPMLMITQKLSGGVNNFPLMALPFFVFAGIIMNNSSVTHRIFSFAKALVGHYRGGLGYVNIVSSMIFSGMTGSAVADAGGLGQVEIKAMNDAGYDESFSIGLTAASSSVGPIIPPSIPFVLFASYAGVSTGALFMGGIIPGIILGIGLCVSCYFISKRRDYPKEPKAGLRGILKSFRSSVLALLMPVLIIGGIWTGLFTATEAAMISIVYALIISIFIFRDLKVRQIGKLLLETLDMILPIMMVIIAATLFTWVISYEKIDTIILKALTSLTDNRHIVVLLICMTTFLTGMIFEGSVVILLLVPLMIPICMTYSISLIHLGVAFVFGTMLGLLTPPVGMTLFMLSSVTKKPYMTIARYILPWLIPLFICWMIVAFWESMVMLIPNIMGFGKSL